MIKTFEQFVSATYGKRINEAFQSRKLKELIKQHGKPKHSCDYELLYDIQDDEIVDVLDSTSEYFDKHLKSDMYGKTFMLELEDGTALAIGNIELLSSKIDGIKKEIKKRIQKRHKGNLGNGGDEIHKKHLENVDKVEKQRLLKKLQPNLDLIAEIIKGEIEKVAESKTEKDDEQDYYRDTVEFEIVLDDIYYLTYMEYEVNFTEEFKRHGAYYYDAVCTLESFEICDEDSGAYVTNDDLDITHKTYKDLFNPYVTKDVQGSVYDFHELYGVRPEDFV